MKRILTIAMMAALLPALGCGYNTMIANDEQVNEAWGNVQTSYQRRMDLIPNLVATVKGAAAFEKETLTAVIEARSKASSIQLTPELLKNKDAFNQFQQSQGELTSALSRLMVVVEKYPDLKANQNFMDLQSQLEGTENRINVARTRFNEAVRIYNTSIRVFPNSCTNSMLLHLELREAFKAAEGADKAPEVKF